MVPNFDLEARSYKYDWSIDHFWRQIRSNPSEAADGTFRLAAFELTTCYGDCYGRPLLIISALILVMTAFYVLPLARRPKDIRRGGMIYRIRPSDRIEYSLSGDVRLNGSAKAERPAGLGWYRGKLKAWRYALYFSLLSAFHIGWRDLNVGSWLARMQFTEYTLRPHGWVRLVSGLQSLAGVYLVAMWVITYFGRPFQ